MRGSSGLFGGEGGSYANCEVIKAMLVVRLEVTFGVGVKAKLSVNMETMVNTGMEAMLSVGG